MSAVQRMTDRARRWWGTESEHLVHHFIAAPAAAQPVTRDSYLRLWLTDMFLAEARRHAADVFPALRASVTLSYAGGFGATKSTILQSPPGQEAPGPRSGSLTGWLPYAGGTVAVQACLYSVKSDDALRLALDIVGGFASLVAPSVSALAGIGEQVAAGIDRIESAIEDAGESPVLLVDKEYAGAGATVDRLAPGHLVVINTPARDFDVDKLDLGPGGLRYRGAPLDGVDYLLIEIQSVRERDDWAFPELDELLRAAKEAQLRHETNRFERLRDELLVRIYTSPDLTPADQRRVATAMRAELDDAALGAAARDEVVSIAGLVGRRGLPPAEAVVNLTLPELLS
ncbi:hypothetical protein [Actinoplanes sp. NPDC026623]|uniref:hypothetical protein n=1 Tax=Actinoplanes sp. NPDC026623 TaxID=3155610 RepID=UPI0033CE14D8